MSVGKGKEQRENLDGGGQGTRAVRTTDHAREQELRLYDGDVLKRRCAGWYQERER